MTKCVYCKKEEEFPIGYRRNFCDSCVQDKEVGVPHAIEMVKLKTMSAPRAWLNELERRRILPYKKEGGGYYLGRKMENGTVSENKRPFM